MNERELGSNETGCPPRGNRRKVEHHTTAELGGPLWKDTGRDWERRGRVTGQCSSLMNREIETDIRNQCWVSLTLNHRTEGGTILYQTREWSALVWLHSTPLNHPLHNYPLSTCENFPHEWEAPVGDEWARPTGDPTAPKHQRQCQDCQHSLLH